MDGGPERQEATEYFRLALRAASNIYSFMQQELAFVYQEAAKHLESRHAERGRPEYSRWNKCSAIKEDARSIEARQLYKEALNIFILRGREVSTEVAQIYVGLASLHKTADLLTPQQLQADPEASAVDYLTKAINILELCLGFDHPETGEAYSKMGLCC